MKTVQFFKLMGLYTDLPDEEFKVLYYILCKLKESKERKIKLYTSIIADETGKTVRRINSITDSLHEKGIIQKEKSTVYSIYALGSYDEEFEKIVENLVNKNP